MRRAVIVVSVILGMSSAGYGKTSSRTAAMSVNDTVPLSDAVAAIESALDSYQTIAKATTDHTVPPLVSADFDFKTTLDTKNGATIKLLIFTIGATKDTQQTNELEFQYVPREIPGADRKTVMSATEPLYVEIIKTLEESAKEIKRVADRPATPGKQHLDLCQMTLTWSFGVTKEGTGSAGPSVSLVTFTASTDRSKNYVQQVKLTFKVADPSNKSCK